MNIEPSDFVDIKVLGDITIIKLLEASKYRFDPTPIDNKTREIDLDLLFAKLKGEPLPALPSEQKPSYPNQPHKLCDYLIAFLDDNQPTKIVLDFAGLDRIGDIQLFSSPMVSFYFSATRRTTVYGGRWAICGLTECGRSFYDFLLHHCFPKLHDTLSDAVAAFAEDEPPKPPAKP